MHLVVVKCQKEILQNYIVIHVMDTLNSDDVITVLILQSRNLLICVTLIFGK